MCQSLERGKVDIFLHVCLMFGAKSLEVHECMHVHVSVIMCVYSMVQGDHSYVHQLNIVSCSECDVDSVCYSVLINVAYSCRHPKRLLGFFRTTE